MNRLLYKLSRWISSRPWRPGTPLREDIDRSRRLNKDESFARRVRAEVAAGAGRSGEAVASPVRGWEPLDFNRLWVGDLVRHPGGGMAFVVHAVYGTRATAARTVDLINPAEWEMLRGGAREEAEYSAEAARIQLKPDRAAHG